MDELSRPLGDPAVDPIVELVGFRLSTATVLYHAAVAERLAQRIRSGEQSLLEELAAGKLDSIKSKMIARAYKEGDALTREVVDESADLLGVAIANVVTLLGLPRVVLGGGLTEAIGDPYVNRVRKAVRREVFFEATRAVEVVASTLEDNAGLLGAALLARERLG